MERTRENHKAEIEDLKQQLEEDLPRPQRRPRPMEVGEPVGPRGAGPSPLQGRRELLEGGLLGRPMQLGSVLL